MHLPCPSSVDLILDCCEMAETPSLGCSRGHGLEVVAAAPLLPSASPQRGTMFCEATGQGILSLPVEYSPSWVLPQNKHDQGQRKGEGKAGEEKPGQAPEQMGAGEGPGAAVPAGT